jgi:Predicted membrane protein
LSVALPHDVAYGSRRIEIIDTLRGLALVAMATYHFSWDLEFFGYLDPGTTTHGFLKLYARGIAGSFLFLVGLSLVLGHYPAIRWSSFGKRLAMIVAAALAISAATYIATPDAFIFFGILHSIALASALGLAFLRLPPILTMLVGAAAIALPQVWRSDLFDASWLWWTGLATTPPRSNDYVPLMPWLGMVLFGIATGRLLLSSGWLDRLRQVSPGPRLLRLAGRHSLAVYLVHQPLLIAIAWLMTLVAPPAAPDSDAAYLRSCELNCSAQPADPGLCVRFCACTLDRLQQQNLFADLQSGAISIENDDRISRLASECTAASQ